MRWPKIASLKHVHEMNGFLQELKDTGCIAPKVPQGITTAAGNALSEELGAERAVLLIPAEAFEVSGSYEKLRICADAICRSELLRTLPKEWQECFFFLAGCNLIYFKRDSLLIVLFSCVCICVCAAPKS